MSSHSPYEPALTDQTLIREVVPSHGAKLLARLMMVPVNTAHHWLYVKLCAARRRELALKLIAELDQQERRRQEVRRQLEAIVHGGEPVEVGGAWPGEAAHGAAMPPTRPPAGEVGRR